jgi:hypothetical protein
MPIASYKPHLLGAAVDLGISGVDDVHREIVILLGIIRGMQIAAIHQMILPDGISDCKDPPVNAIQVPVHLHSPRFGYSIRCC